MRALMVLAILMLAGCFPISDVEWQPTSIQGRQCFHGCNSTGHVCRAHCLTGWACVAECDMAANECKAGCPDMVPIKVVPDVQNDQDCWRFDICGRGECVVRYGRCVRR